MRGDEDKGSAGTDEAATAAIGRFTLDSVPIESPGWRIYKDHFLNDVGDRIPVGPADFHPSCRYRFSGVDASPRRSMLYIAETAAAAAWETVLRHVYAGPRSVNGKRRALVRKDALADRYLALLWSLRTMQVISLFPESIRQFVDDEKQWQEWLTHTIRCDHEPTVQAAAWLLKEASLESINPDGLTWFSRQAGSKKGHPIVYLYYGPKVTSEDFSIPPDNAPMPLESPQGRAFIKELLDAAKLTWVAADPDDGWLAEE